MCHKKKLHLLVLQFLPLNVTNSPGGGETGLIQTVVSADMCSVPCRNNIDAVAAVAGMVDVVGGATAGAALRIVPC